MPDMNAPRAYANLAKEALSGRKVDEASVQATLALAAAVEQLASAIREQNEDRR